jgi:hypothetical protein
MGCEPRTNVLKDEKGDLHADCQCSGEVEESVRQLI